MGLPIGTWCWPRDVASPSACDMFRNLWQGGRHSPHIQIHYRAPVLRLSIGLGAPDHNVRQAAYHGKPANTHYRHGATRPPGSRALNREQRSAAHTHKMWHTRRIKRQTCPRHIERIICMYIYIYIYIYERTRSTMPAGTSWCAPHPPSQLNGIRHVICLPLQHEHT